MLRKWQFIVGSVIVIALCTFGINFVVGNPSAKLLKKAREAVSQGKWEEALQYYTEATRSARSLDLLAEGYLGLGDVQFEKKNLLEAKSTYEKIVHDFPNSNKALIAQEHLGKVNMAILASPLLTPMYKKIEAQSGDSLARIAKAHGTTVDLLIQMNQLKGSKILPGMKLKVPERRFSVLVDKSQNTLTLKSGEEIFKVYTAATGENNSTPVGTFKITNKLEHPVWYTLGAVVPPESPENVLGSRWMGINERGYGIHGTKDPSSIGKQTTQGCVRMLNEDVEELYGVVPIGTEVTIID